MVVAWLTGIKLPSWQKWLTLLLDLILIAIILLIVVICIAIVYASCEYMGLNQGGAMAAVASPVASIVDWWSGNELGSSFVEVCKVLGSTAQ